LTDTKGLPALQQQKEVALFVADENYERMKKC
jgi:hypothetical protein